MQVNNPLVSVIIPTYNRPDFLKKTIQSIISQDYQYIEIIIVSNGYSIENKNVTNSFLDPRIFYVEQENSGGPASPRNHGIKLAKGALIAFCDDDDLWMPNKLSKQISLLLDNEDCGVCFTKMLRFDEIGKEWSVAQEESNADLNSLLYVNTVPISSLVVKKKLIDQLGGFCESKIVGTAEDYEFILRCSSITKFATVLHHCYYLKYIIGCYYLHLVANRISIKKLFLPMIYQIKMTLKRIFYIWYSNFKNC